MGEWMDQGHAQCESVRRAAAAASGAPTGTDQIDNPCASHSPCWSTLQAAEVLSCRPLLEYCQGRLGQMAQGVRIHRFGDVVAANAAGNVWLILDSMVLDIKSWLPEHPGGSSIIPRQSLNCDCARFFEMYHASRESFLYLRDFYLGEIHPDDRGLVPQGGEDRARGRAAEPPGPDFLQQLREYTEAFRLKLGPGGELLHAAYADVRTHLGARS